MLTVNVRETRERLSSLLDAVAAGEEVLILRNGKPAARITSPGRATVPFINRADLRRSLPAAQESAVSTVSRLRDNARY